MVRISDVLSKSLESTRRHLLKRREQVGDNQVSILSGEDAEFWYNSFKELFQDTEESADGDDLLFFVTHHALQQKPEDPDSRTDINNRHASTNSAHSEDGNQKSAEAFFVLRRSSTKIPVMEDPAVDWESTYYLNTVLHGFQYTLTIVIGTRDDTSGHIVPENTVSRRVYPSPSRTRMDQSKGTVTEMTYPRIFFPVDDFEDFFQSVVCTEGGIVCVELTAQCTEFVTSIFQGSVPYPLLLQAFNKKVNAASWNPLVTKSCDSMEFLKMRGPKGVGQAEMAVSRVSAEYSADGRASDPPTPGKSQANGGLKGFFASTLRGLTTPHPSALELEAAPNLNACLTFVNIRLKHLVVNVLGAKPHKPLLKPGVIPEDRV
ncbi:hypothetical protein SARC_00016 [Sphaeroforma arctica JP610]|uniref:Uncharacterized protein n=1 Tax=Sphaeroforma arctica JP610 TaxID=667725 RepID=A0A0L0GFU0_9EUKA|nr:hypothetical protein SARC_00016 [Sphaeroforma arctica JP610]KNC87882.1 hypothetical protein SARC_00016 [Sphaeroforma arctica JP610]|eukprot:XP_014161784.1 hypothetical protein SARC_00016 [Sphaeroforma arctica JP610]